MQNHINPINTGLHGETLYRISLGTGTAWTAPYLVYAYNEQEAVDLVADYLDEHEVASLYCDYYELADLCETEQTVDEYAEANGLICAGNHGIYIQVLGIETVAQ
jgi:hypothetical protein